MLLNKRIFNFLSIRPYISFHILQTPHFLRFLLILHLGGFEFRIKKLLILLFFCFNVKVHQEFIIIIIIMDVITSQQFSQMITTIKFPK